MPLNLEKRLLVDRLLAAALDENDNFIQMALDELDQYDLLEVYDALSYLLDEAHRRRKPIPPQTG